MIAYHFNVVSHLIFGIAGVLLGYYFANESWRHNRMWEWKSITQQLRLQETEIHRLETINESLVGQLKELKYRNSWRMCECQDAYCNCCGNELVCNNCREGECE